MKARMMIVSQPSKVSELMMTSKCPPWPPPLPPPSSSANVDDLGRRVAAFAERRQLQRAQWPRDLGNLQFIQLALQSGRSLHGIAADQQRTASAGNPPLTRAVAHAIR